MSAADRNDNLSVQIEVAPSASAAAVLLPPAVDMFWYSKTGHLLDQKKRIYGQIKMSSFEGRLVQLLIEQSLSKDQLCRQLWPAEGAGELLRTRFHSLIKRVNYKVRDLIIYQGEVYGLAQKIVIK